MFWLSGLCGLRLHDLPCFKVARGGCLHPPPVVCACSGIMQPVKTWKAALAICHSRGHVHLCSLTDLDIICAPILVKDMSS